MDQINATIPMSYNFGPTVGEHFQNAVKLADMMDKRKELVQNMDIKREQQQQDRQLFPLQMQQGQQTLKTAQQTYNQNELTNPLTYEKMQEENRDILINRKNENLEIMAKSAPNVVDEPSYKAWKKFADLEVGGDTSDLPATYNDEAKLYVKNIIDGYSSKKNQEKDFQIKMQSLKEIAALPEGPEKEQAFAQFMLSSAPAAFYPTSTEGIGAAVKKIQATATPSAQAAGKEAYAKEVAKEATPGGKLDLATKIANVKKREAEATALAASYENARKERTGIKNIIGEITNDPAFATGLNPRRLLSVTPGMKEYAWVEKIKMLKNKLKLNERQKLKGSGQISDAEQKMLENAVSMLNTNLGPDAFRKELNRIVNTINYMDESDLKMGGSGSAVPKGESKTDQEKLDEIFGK